MMAVWLTLIPFGLAFLFIFFLFVGYFDFDPKYKQYVPFVQLITFLLIIFLPLGVSAHLIRKRLGTGNDKDFIRPLWEISPMLAVAVGLALTLSVLIPKDPNGTIAIENLQQLVTAASAGIVSSIVTFIGISIWIFVEQVANVAEKLKNDLSSSTAQMKREAYSSFTSLGRIASAVKFISLFRGSGTGQENKPDRLFIRKRLASDSICSNLNKWEHKFFVAGTSEWVREERQLLWLSVMEAYFIEEGYDIHQNKLSTNTRNYPYIIASLLTDLLSEENLGGKGNIHFYAKCEPDWNQMFPNTKDTLGGRKVACSAAELYNVIKYWRKNANMITKKKLVACRLVASAADVNDVTNISNFPTYTDMDPDCPYFLYESARSFDNTKSYEYAIGAWRTQCNEILSSIPEFNGSAKEFLYYDATEVLDFIRKFKAELDGINDRKEDIAKAIQSIGDFYRGYRLSKGSLSDVILLIGPNQYRCVDMELGLYKISLFRFFIGLWSFFDVQKHITTNVKQVLVDLFGAGNIKYYRADGIKGDSIPLDYALIGVSKEDKEAPFDNVDDFDSLICISSSALLTKENNSVGEAVVMDFVDAYETDASKAEVSKAKVDGILKDFVKTWKNSIV